MSGGWNIKEIAKGLAFVIGFCVVAWFLAALIGLGAIWLLFAVGVKTFGWIVAVIAIVVIGIIFSLW